MEEKKETVAVVGASPLKDRYSNQAQTMLEEYGHSPVPVAPKHETIEGKTVYHALSDIPHSINTVTMYIGPARQDKVIGPNSGPQTPTGDLQPRHGKPPGPMKNLNLRKSRYRRRVPWFF